MDVKKLFKLFSFHGRIGRGTFWGIGVAAYGFLFVALALLEVHVVLGYIAYAVALVVMLATNVKRWHDRNKSGAWVFINLIPIVGGLWALVEQGFLAGTNGGNQYGAPDSGSPFGARVRVRPFGARLGLERGGLPPSSRLEGMTDDEVVAAWRARHGR